MVNAMVLNDYLSEIIAERQNDSPKFYCSYIRALHKEKTGIPSPDKLWYRSNI